jgi:hypothetical protein
MAAVIANPRARASINPRAGARVNPGAGAGVNPRASIDSPTILSFSAFKGLKARYHH